VVTVTWEILRIGEEAIVGSMPYIRSAVNGEGVHDTGRTIGFVRSSPNVVLAVLEEFGPLECLTTEGEEKDTAVEVT